MSEGSRYPYNKRGGKFLQKSPYNTQPSTDWTFLRDINFWTTLKLNNFMLYIYLYFLIIILLLSSKALLFFFLRTNDTLVTFSLKKKVSDLLHLKSF
jgi:hypothetical protein